MNDRDFKLLVRSYFQQQSKITHSGYIRLADESEKLLKIEQRILFELELFTKEDVQELPFKD